MENRYYEAIHKGETVDFLLGKNKYHIPDRERAGMHEMSVTVAYLNYYCQTEGNEKMLAQLKKDILLTLEKELIPHDLSMLIGYIYIYQRDYYEENSFSVEWILDEKTISLIREKLNLFLEIYKEEDAKLDYTKKENSHGYFLNNTLRLLNLLQEKFKISI